MKTLREIIETADRFFGPLCLMDKNIMLKRNLDNNGWCLFEGNTCLISTDDGMNGELEDVELFPSGYPISDEIISHYESI